jgi:hypothetical protein
MSSSIHERHLIDRYLNGELSGLELEEFNNRLSSDGGFLQVMELQKVIYNGASHAREEEIKRKIRCSINYRKTFVPFALKLIITFFFILILGILFWSYVGNEFERFKPYNNFISIFKKQPKDTAFEKNKSREPVKIENEGAKNIHMADTSVKDTTNLSSDTTAAVEAEGEDIEVKKDIMIVSILLPVMDKSLQKVESQSNDIAEKLPEADLPFEGRVDTFTVEFWVSPIHYKGYKMSKNKLLLFGIENIEDVKLYRVNNVIYMRYGESLYPLSFTYDFMPYQKLKEAETPQELK